MAAPGPVNGRAPADYRERVEGGDITDRKKQASHAVSFGRWIGSVPTERHIGGDARTTRLVADNATPATHRDRLSDLRLARRATARQPTSRRRRALREDVARASKKKTRFLRLPFGSVARHTGSIGAWERRAVVE